MTGFSFRDARPKRREVDAVPMINVAFLLLVFFLLAARIAPPEPVEVALPEAEGDLGTAVGTLFVAADGTLAFEGSRGAAAFAAAVALEGPLTIAADREADANALAALLSRLARAGAGEVSLAVDPLP